MGRSAGSRSAARPECGQEQAGQGRQEEGERPHREPRAIEGGRQGRRAVRRRREADGLVLDDCSTVGKEGAMRIGAKSSEANHFSSTLAHALPTRRKSILRSTPPTRPSGTPRRGKAGSCRRSSATTAPSGDAPPRQQRPAEVDRDRPHRAATGEAGRGRHIYLPPVHVGTRPVHETRDAELQAGRAARDPRR